MHVGGGVGVGVAGATIGNLDITRSLMQTFHNKPVLHVSTPPSSHMVVPTCQGGRCNYVDIYVQPTLVQVCHLPHAALSMRCLLKLSKTHKSRQNGGYRASSPPNSAVLCCVAFRPFPVF
jgi:hypothetical protein